MKVLIREKKGGKPVATHEVSMRGLNYTASQEEFFDLAWKEP
jgi:hypothetical protein